MIIKFNLGFIRVTFTVAPVQKIIGVNSNLDPEKKYHILMWDFDDVNLLQVLAALKWVQKLYDLADIYVLESSPNHYIAYCLQKTPWRKAVAIIANTPYVDWNFFKYGVYRGHFTLRVSKKNGYKPRVVAVLRGKRRWNVTEKDLKSWTIYETLYEPKKWGPLERLKRWFFSRKITVEVR